MGSSRGTWTRVPDPVWGWTHWAKAGWVRTELRPGLHQLVRTTRGGWPAVAVYARTPPGHGNQTYWAICEVIRMALNSRPPLGVVGGVAPFEDDKGFRARYPRLWSYLTDGTWEGGEARELSTLLLIPQDGVFRIMLKEPNWGLCLWATAPSVTDLFGVLEARLADPKADWRVDRKKAGQQASRRQRPS